MFCGRGEHGGRIVDADDGGQRVVARVGLDPRDAGIEIAELDLERGAVGERLEHRPLVRADGDLDGQRMRRADEIGGAVGRRRDQQEKARHHAAARPRGRVQNGLTPLLPGWKYGFAPPA